LKEVKEIQIGKIKVGAYEQRISGEDEGIAELAASITRIGLVNPVLVAKSGDGYTIIAGHRRLEAAKKAGLDTLPAIVQTGKKEVEAEISFAENFFRKDLSPVELAAALKDCVENQVMTYEELAEGFHRSVHWVKRMVAIYDWPADVLHEVHAENMSIAAAANLACITDSTYRQFLIRNAVENGATARTTAAWLQAFRSMQPPEQAVTAEPVPGVIPKQPLIPQAPCFSCGTMFEVNQISHVPMCGSCIQTIRRATMSGG